MSDQIIISVGREYRSGGEEVAKELSQRFGIKLYSKNILHEIAAGKSLDEDELAAYDEMPRHLFFSRHVMGYSNSPEENVAHMQFDFLRERAEEGESFVLLGRCGANVLADYPALVSVFLTASMDFKVHRCMDIENLTKDEALRKVEDRTKRRREYHDYFCNQKFGVASTYDLCVATDVLGVDGTVDAIEAYVYRVQNARRLAAEAAAAGAE